MLSRPSRITIHTLGTNKLILRHTGTYISKYVLLFTNLSYLAGFLIHIHKLIINWLSVQVKENVKGSVLLKVNPWCYMVIAGIEIVKYGLKRK